VKEIEGMMLQQQEQFQSQLAADEDKLVDGDKVMQAICAYF
jgi:hypothetical protein